MLARCMGRLCHATTPPWARRRTSRLCLHPNPALLRLRITPRPQGMVAAGIAPKLRSYTPALIAYAERGEADKAFEGGGSLFLWFPCCRWCRHCSRRCCGCCGCCPGGPCLVHCDPSCPGASQPVWIQSCFKLLVCPCTAVDAAIAAQQIDLTEAEFARLLQAAAAGASWERAAGVLRRIGSELTVLCPATLRRVRALFASPAAAAAFASSGPAGTPAAGAWEVAETTISPTGRCACCGGQLAASDLSDDEFATFAQGIAASAE